MRTRIGVGVGRKQVRAVIVRRGSIRWRASHDIRDGDVEGALYTLLSQAPHTRLGTPRVVAAIGPSASQLKRLAGLPRIDSPATAARMLRENVSRFFLHAETSEARVAVFRNGTWWGALFRESVLAQVERACDRANVRLDGTLPAIAALASVLPDGCLQWYDDGIRDSFRIANKSWDSLRRDRPSEQPEPDVAVLRGLNADQLLYADAFAATFCDRRSPLWLRPLHSRGSRVSLALRIVLAAMCAVAIGASMAARGIKATRQLALDSHRLDSLRVTLASSQPAMRQLDDATAALNEISRFIRGRRSSVHLLAGIAESLPDSTAIVSLRLDTLSGSAMLLSTVAASVVPRLDAVDGIEAPRISGAVTRETVNGVAMQRIALRFRLQRADSTRSGR